MPPLSGWLRGYAVFCQGVAALSTPWRSVWRGVLAGADGEDTGPGIDTLPSRPAMKDSAQAITKTPDPFIRPVGILRHRQPKGSETDRPHLNHRATSRLYNLTILQFAPPRPRPLAPPHNLRESCPRSRGPASEGKVPENFKTRAKLPGNVFSNRVRTSHQRTHCLPCRKMSYTGRSA
jgi:hypothetical protein